jgi:outer membrane protein assembly factor BamA
VVEVETRSLPLQILAWPFERVVTPVVKFLVYPAVPPLRYINDQKLIEKGINLASFGPENQMFFYPTFNMRTGSGSNVGASLRIQRLLFNHDRFSFSPRLYVNGDTYYSWNYSKSKILGSDFYTSSHFNYRQDSDAGLSGFVYTDSSFAISAAVGGPVYGSLGWELSFAANLRRYGKPTTYDSILTDVSGIDPVNLGFYQHYQEYPVRASLIYNSRDTRFTTTDGSYLRASYTFTPVSRYGGNRKHDYHLMEFVAQHYLLIGRRTYEMTVQESNVARKKWQRMGLKDAMEVLDPRNIRETLFERRVLVGQIRLGETFAVHEGYEPSTAWWLLGRDFPLRYYSGFNGTLVAGVSLEYRFPLDRLADGVVFNEYGIFGKDWSNLKWSNLRNSWGFGVQVRTPRMFITRFQIAFHGAQGIAMVLTTSPTYE